MSESDYDSDQKNADAPEGEFGFDYDSNDVLYHYGDGFATGSDGKQYMEAGGGHVVDMETNQVHYAPSGSNAESGGGNLAGFYVVALIACVILFFVSVKLLFDPDVDHTLRWTIDVVVSVLGAVYFFNRLRQK